MDENELLEQKVLCNNNYEVQQFPFPDFHSVESSSSFIGRERERGAGKSLMRLNDDQDKENDDEGFSLSPFRIISLSLSLFFLIRFFRN